MKYSMRLVLCLVAVLCVVVFANIQHSRASHFWQNDVDGPIEDFDVLVDVSGSYIATFGQFDRHCFDPGTGHFTGDEDVMVVQLEMVDKTIGKDGEGVDQIVFDYTGNITIIASMDFHNTPFCQPSFEKLSDTTLTFNYPLTGNVIYRWEERLNKFILSNQTISGSVVDLDPMACWFCQGGCNLNETMKVKFVPVAQGAFTDQWGIGVNVDGWGGYLEVVRDFNSTSVAFFDSSCPDPGLKPFPCDDQGLQALQNACAIWTIPLDVNDTLLSVNGNGEIKGLLKSSQIVLTAENDDPDLEDNDIQKATINLYKQDSFIREKLPDETTDEYNAFVETQGRQLVKTDLIEQDELGRFSFRDIIAFDSDSNGRVNPVYYIIEATNAESEELIVDSDRDFDPEDPERTRTLYFIDGIAVNVRPDISEPIAEHEITLGPFDNVGTKLDLALALSLLSPNNYAEIEDDVRSFVGRIKDGDVEKTAEVLEGLKRSIWAERTVKVGSEFSKELLTISLDGFVTLLSDLFGGLVDFASKAPPSIQNQMDQVNTTSQSISPAYAAGFSLDPEDLPTEAVGTTMNSLLQPYQNAEFLDRLNTAVSALKPVLREELVFVGMARADATKVADITVAVLNSLLNFAREAAFSGNEISAGGLARGAAQSVKGILLNMLKDFVKDVSLALLLDDPDLDSFHKQTSDALRHSVDRLTGPWDKADSSVYARERNQVVDIMNEMSDQATDVINRAVTLQLVAGALGEAENLITLVGTIIPPGRAITEFAAMLVKITRYLSNVGSTVDPFVAVFWDMNRFVNRGAFKAYGENPPASSTLARDVGPLRVSSSDNGGKAQSNLIAKSVSGDGLTEVLRKISEGLIINDVNGAIKLTADNQNGYVGELNAWNNSVSIFFAQARGNALNAMDLLVEESELRAALADLTQKVVDFYVNVLTIKYADVNDRLYIAERDSVTFCIDSAINKVNEFAQSLNDAQSQASEEDILPAVFTQTSLPVSDSTGKVTITASPEEFTYLARIKNVSAVAVSGLSSKLTVVSANDSIEISGNQEVAVGNGTLTADDGAENEGKDEAVIEWKLKYKGDLSSELIMLSINILENGKEPVGFASIEAQNMLLIDPSKSDKDLDQMPDVWEKANGLNINKDDSLDDKDKDGLLNIEEFNIGTDPQKEDTDGDGAKDGEEINGGNNDFVTDPLNKDSDGDGVLDGADGQPLDAGSSDQPQDDNDFGEPAVSISAKDVALTSDARVAFVDVTNSGEGTLVWTATSGNDAVAVTSPNLPNTHTGNGSVFISAPAGFDFDTPGILTTKVTVFDAKGADRDFKEITVNVGSGDKRVPPGGSEPGPTPGPGQDIAPGEVFGVVIDEAGNPVAGAQVVIKRFGFKDETATDETGLFKFEGLEAKRHALIIKAKGFSTSRTRLKLSPKKGVDVGNVVLVAK